MLAIAYYLAVPAKTALQKRLPNKVDAAGILLAIVIAAAVWFILESFSGFGRVVRIMTFLLALLVFESFFLLSLRFWKSNTLGVLASLSLAAGLFWLAVREPSFLLVNTIIIVATLGATTLLIRMGYLRTRFLFLFTSLWTLYDILSTRYLLPTVFVPAQEPYPTLFFPAVTVGHTTLGSGDFMFLTLFTLIVLRDFGRLPALVLVIAETVGLLATGLFLPERGFLVPFLVVMTPIFFGVYLAAFMQRPRSLSPSRPR